MYRHGDCKTALHHSCCRWASAVHTAAPYLAYSCSCRQDACGPVSTRQESVYCRCSCSSGLSVAKGAYHSCPPPATSLDTDLTASQQGARATEVVVAIRVLLVLLFTVWVLAGGKWCAFLWVRRTCCQCLTQTLRGSSGTMSMVLCANSPDQHPQPLIGHCTASRPLHTHSFTRHAAHLSLSLLCTQTHLHSRRA